MQTNAPVIHRQEGDRQHQRNGDAHHQARTDVDIPAPPQGVHAGAAVKAQGNHTDRQHNGHRLNQHPHKFIDRFGHRLRLILQLHQLHPGGQAFFNACECRFQRLAQGNDVSALHHRNPQRNDFFALVVHLHTRWVGVAALDLRNIPQAQLVARDAPNRHGTQVFHGIELASNPNLHDVGWRVNGACRFHRILLAELGQHLVHVQAQLRQALL